MVGCPLQPEVGNHIPLNFLYGSCLHHTLLVLAKWLRGFRQRPSKNLLENSPINRKVSILLLFRQDNVNSFLFQSNNLVPESFPNQNWYVLRVFWLRDVCLFL